MPHSTPNQTSRVRTVFDDWAVRGRAEGMERGHGPVARKAFHHLGLKPDSWYLDVGCGNGYTVRWAAEDAPDGKAFGLDVAPEMIARAEEMSQGVANAEFHVATFPDHDLPLGRFDAIFSMEVLYYLPSLSEGLEEVARLLTPGGRFVCVVDFYQENSASHSWPEDVGVAMRLLSAAQWRQAFEDAGLKVIEQGRVTLPPEQATEGWKVDVGSLMTVGVSEGESEDESEGSEGSGSGGGRR